MNKLYVIIVSLVTATSSVLLVPIIPYHNEEGMEASTKHRCVYNEDNQASYRRLVTRPIN